jgi:hypothetical protein
MRNLIFVVPSAPALIFRRKMNHRVGKGSSRTYTEAHNLDINLFMMSKALGYGYKDGRIPLTSHFVVIFFLRNQISLLNPCSSLLDGVRGMIKAELQFCTPSIVFDQ